MPGQQEMEGGRLRHGSPLSGRRRSSSSLRGTATRRKWNTYRPWRGRAAAMHSAVYIRLGLLEPHRLGKEDPRDGEREAPGKRQTMPTARTLYAGIESPFAWLRLVVALVLGTIGGVGMWSVPLVLPAVQVEFGVARADASLPFTLAMVGFALGGVLMGRLSDRFGIVMPVLCG